MNGKVAAEHKYGSRPIVRVAEKGDKEGFACWWMRILHPHPSPDRYMGQEGGGEVPAHSGRRELTRSLGGLARISPPFRENNR